MGAGVAVGDRSGLEFVELAMIMAIANLAVKADGDSAATPKVLARVEQTAGLGPIYGYPLLLDLSPSWKINVPLISLLGLHHDRRNIVAPPEASQATLTQAGRVAIDAEEGHIAPVPVRIINGTMYRGGSPS